MRYGPHGLFDDPGTHDDEHHDGRSRLESGGLVDDITPVLFPTQFIVPRLHLHRAPANLEPVFNNGINQVVVILCWNGKFDSEGVFHFQGSLEEGPARVY